MFFYFKDLRMDLLALLCYIKGAFKIGSVRWVNKKTINMVMYSEVLGVE